MKIYKVSYYSHQDGSLGFSYHASKVKASCALSKFKRSRGDDFSDNSMIEKIETRISAEAILELLNAHASHNDNG